MRNLFKTFLLLFIIFISLPSHAWNEDFSTPPPGQRGICIKNLSSLPKGSLVNVRSVTPDESCATDEARYQWLIGKDPKGSMAFIPSKSINHNTFPPSVVSWPSSENSNSPRVWHFTCMGTIEKDLLGTQMKDFVYKGEITAPSKYQSCEAAYVMARTVCGEQMGGNDLFEQCSGGSNYLLDTP